MAPKKAVKGQKKVSKTKKVSKPKPAKEKTLKTAGKPRATAEKVKVAKKPSQIKKLPARTSVKTDKKELKEISHMKTAKKGAADKTPATPKKKLSPREKKIREIRENLMKQKITLLTEAEEALNALPGQTIFPDLGDQASAEIDRTFMLRLRGREQRLLKKIEAAIEQIENGAFGICEVCGEEIDLKRLEARPVTTMCIFCKTEEEEEEKLRKK